MPDTARAWLWVALGGALGSTARFFVQSQALARAGSYFPWGTLGVNLIGAALMGLLMGLTQGRASPAALFLGTGVLGGFTTYSAFNHETVLLATQGTPLRAAVYVAATVVGALLLGGLGYWLGRALAPAPA
jgi:CrcB protein